MIPQRFLPFADGIVFINSLKTKPELVFYTNNKKSNIMGIKTGPKKVAKSTGKPDKRQRDNKETPSNTPSLKPHEHKKGD